MKRNSFFPDPGIFKPVPGALLPVLKALVFAVLALYAFRLAQAWLGIHVWRHDSVYYMNSYWHNLCGEGRWLNFLVYDTLKSIPPHLAIFFCLGSIFYFFLICALPFTGMPGALAFALAGINLPSLCDQLSWPLVTVPSFCVLAILVFLKNRLDWRVILLLGGILYNGSFNNFYSLLPFLYLNEIYGNKISPLAFLCWYVGCFVLGFGICELITFMITGSAIQVEAWRKPRPVSSLMDLLENIKMEGNLFYSMLFATGVLAPCACLFSLLAALALDAKKRIAILKTTLIALVAMASCFAQAVPLGIIVMARSALALFSGLLLLPLLAIGRHAAIAWLALIIASTAMHRTSMHDLMAYSTLTNIFYENLPKAEPRLQKVIFFTPPDEFRRVENEILHMNGLNWPMDSDSKLPMDQGRWPIMEGLGEPMRIIPVFFEAGFNYVYVDDASRRDMVRKVIGQMPPGEWRHNEFYRWRTFGDWLVIGIDWPKTHGLEAEASQKP